MKASISQTNGKKIPNKNIHPWPLLVASKSVQIWILSCWVGTFIYASRYRDAPASACYEVLSPPDRDGLDARAGVERPQEVADVVPHGLDAELELTRYLLGRVATLEEAQHLSLPWRQVRMRWRRRLGLFDILDLAEDADHVPTAAKWNRAELDGHSLAIRVEEHALVVRAVWWSEKVPGEDTPSPQRFLGCDDGCKLAAANVAHELHRGRVQPADDPVLVDQVGGDTDAADGVFDIASEGLQFGHAFESAPREAPAQPRTRAGSALGGGRRVFDIAYDEASIERDSARASRHHTSS